MAKWDSVDTALEDAWSSFIMSIRNHLGDDFDSNKFYNVADSGFCKIDDAVRQSVTYDDEDFD